jgi:hypothetical protein
VAPISTSYSSASTVTPVIPGQSAVTDSNYNTGGSTDVSRPQYTQNTGPSSYQQSSYPSTGQYPQNNYSSSTQQSYYAGQALQSSLRPFFKPPYCRRNTLKENVDNPTDQGSFAPQGSNLHIGPDTWGLDDPLDPRKLQQIQPKSILILLGFKIHKGSRFDVGEVFKILWAEPKGNNGTRLTEDGRGHSQKFGQNFIHKIRRFVIVTAFKGHCLCL